jgi:hypothetical protein
MARDAPSDVFRRVLRFMCRSISGAPKEWGLG